MSDRLDVVVTGACGRLGVALLPALRRSRGVGEILALDVREVEQPIDGVRYQRADVRDAAAMEQHLRGRDAVLHLAFIVERGSRDAAFVDAVNIGGSEKVARAAARAGVDRLVYASSIASYGFWPDNHGRLLTEDAPLRGNDEFYYTRTKAEVERRYDAIAAEHPQMAIARLRPTTFTLEAMVPPAGFPLALVLGGATAPLHLTHMDDVCDAFVLALERRLAGAYNVANEGPIAPEDIAAALGVTGVKVPIDIVTRVVGLAHAAGLIDVDPQWLRIGATVPILVDATRMRREGWQPRYRTAADTLRAVHASKRGLWARLLG